MDPNKERAIRRVTMVATATAAYLCLTADYGPYPNALDPIKEAIKSAGLAIKDWITKPSEKELEEFRRQKHRAVLEQKKIEDKGHNSTQMEQK